MKTRSFNMQTSDEIKHMIDSLEGMNDEDVKQLYGIDTVEEASIQFWEEYQEMVETESEYEGIGCFQSHGFTSVYDYNSYRY